ncbi:MAG: M48 family metalloprotease [Elusimicrobiota bacterium]
MRIFRLGTAFACAALVFSTAGAFKLKDMTDLDAGKVLSGSKKVAEGAAGISDKDEEALGRDVAAYLCARYGVYRNAAAHRYVNLVGQAVARRSERPGIVYRFGILNTDEVNAYAAPGGYIFITKGLLRFVEDEAELAGALGHEVAHVAKRHVAKAVRKGKFLEGGIELARARKDNPAALKAASDFTIQLLFRGFDRKDEVEADREGPLYAWRAGYDPAGLERVLERMAAGKKGENAFAALDKSHPPARNRLRVVQGEISSQGWGADRPAQAERFRREMSSLPPPAAP